MFITNFIEIVFQNVKLDLFRHRLMVRSEENLTTQKNGRHLQSAPAALQATVTEKAGQPYLFDLSCLSPY